MRRPMVRKGFCSRSANSEQMEVAYEAMPAYLSFNGSCTKSQNASDALKTNVALPHPVPFQGRLATPLTKTSFFPATTSTTCTVQALAVLYRSCSRGYE